jgi:hypothetical protein
MSWRRCSQRYLRGANLTKPELAGQIARWVKLTADKMEIGAAPCDGSLPDGRKLGPQHEAGAILKASRDLGLPKDTVARAVAAESLPQPQPHPSPPSATSRLTPRLEARRSGRGG